MNEKQERFKTTVGSDNDTPATVRTELINDGAGFVATLWAKHRSDQPFDRTFWTNGKRVRVTISEAKEEHQGGLPT